MSILTIRKNAIAPAPVTIPAQPQSPPPKERLIARWLRDETNQLYCQWVKEKS